ncbi:uncharacterized protein VTP21DRAFT_1307 [Calcarisporiella thermophila]|uniref:uncharacterized protein n=1 Tax=Calcarisporiella thermophila TaxID=911321 RepID=UPI003743F12C
MTERPNQGIPAGPWLTPERCFIGSVLLLIGLFLLFGGFGVSRGALFCVGFILFGVLCFVALANSEPPQSYGSNRNVLYMVLCFIFAFIGGIAFLFLIRIAVFFVGGLGGFALAIFILSWSRDHIITNELARAFFIVAFAFAGIFLMAFIEWYVLIFSFAFIGSFCFVLGIDMFANGGLWIDVWDILDRNHRIDFRMNWRIYVELAAILLLFFAGLGYACFMYRGKTFSPASQTSSTDAKPDKRSEEKDAAKRISARETSDLSNQASRRSHSSPWNSAVPWARKPATAVESLQDNLWSAFEAPGAALRRSSERSIACPVHELQIRTGQIFMRGLHPGATSAGRALLLQRIKPHTLLRRSMQSQGPGD